MGFILVCKSLLYYFCKYIVLITSPISLNLLSLQESLFADSMGTKAKKEVNKVAFTERRKPSIDSSIIEWFVGLCEAESKFLIRKRKNKQGLVIGFKFVFRIYLHKDDTEVLKYIYNTTLRTKCGRLSTDRNTSVFTISKLSDIETILIPLFEQFPLNGVKFLDYLDFKKAFFFIYSKIWCIRFTGFIFKYY